METSKHTQGTLEFQKFDEDRTSNHLGILTIPLKVFESGERSVLNIGLMFKHGPIGQPGANAARIVQTWNEYDGLKEENEKLKAVNKELAEALKRALDWFYAHGKKGKIYADGVSPSCIPYIESVISKHSKQ